MIKVSGFLNNKRALAGVGIDRTIILTITNKVFLPGGDK
jgi:hypothetical protein